MTTTRTDETFRQRARRNAYQQACSSGMIAWNFCRVVGNPIAVSSSQGVENTFPELCVRPGHELRQWDRQVRASVLSLKFCY